MLKVLTTVLIMIAINLILFQADIKEITIKTIKTGLIMIHMKTITKVMEVTTILMEIIMTDMENIRNR
jgi:hypothetical protein